MALHALPIWLPCSTPLDIYLDIDTLFRRDSRGEYKTQIPHELRGDYNTQIPCELTVN